MPDVSTADLIAARNLLKDIGILKGKDASKLAKITGSLDTEISRRRQKAVLDKISEKSNSVPRQAPSLVVRAFPKAPGT